jgi:TetR/AcrR family transcriptional regulator, repressor of fatR-cypB operon
MKVDDFKWEEMTMEKTDTDRLKKDKREVILQTALELIAKNGFQHTPMSLIVKHSGASAGIIYHYFTSKDELIHVLYRRVKAELSQAILSADVQHLPLGERFLQVWIRAFHFYATHPYETAFLEQYESTPDTFQTENEELSKDEVALYQLIEEYQSHQLLKDLPYTALYELTFGVAIRLARQHASGQFSGDEAVLKEIAQACWDAITR